LDKEATIRDRAHQIWLEEGQPQGKEGEHWTRASQELGYEDAQSPEDLKDKTTSNEGTSLGGISPGVIPPPD
jgi:hypothetical protein